MFPRPHVRLHRMFDRDNEFSVLGNGKGKQLVLIMANCYCRRSVYQIGPDRDCAGNLFLLPRLHPDQPDCLLQGANRTNCRPPSGAARTRRRRRIGSVGRIAAACATTKLIHRPAGLADPPRDAQRIVSRANPKGGHWPGRDAGASPLGQQHPWASGRLWCWIRGVVYLVQGWRLGRRRHRCARTSRSWR